MRGYLPWRDLIVLRVRAVITALLDSSLQICEEVNVKHSPVKVLAEESYINGTIKVHTLSTCKSSSSCIVVECSAEVKATGGQIAMRAYCIHEWCGQCVHPQSKLVMMSKAWIRTALKGSQRKILDHWSRVKTMC